MTLAKIPAQDLEDLFDEVKDPSLHVLKEKNNVTPTWKLVVIATNVTPREHEDGSRSHLVTEYLAAIEGSEPDFLTWNTNKVTNVDEADIGDYDDWKKVAWPKVSGANHIERYNNGLPNYKAANHGLIDARTRELIASGFTYNLKTFSLSPEAQSMWHGMHQDRANLTYPVTVNVIDDTDEESIADATGVEAFYTAMVTQVRAGLDGGTALKSSIRSATTHWDVMQVEDNR